MRRLLIALVLLALPGMAGAEDFIRYTPPGLLSCSSGVFCLPTGTTSIRIYNGTNLEYGELLWDSNNFELRTVANGGTNRSIAIEPAAGSTGTTYVRNIVAGSSDANDLGASGTLWRNSYISRSIQGGKAKSLTDAAAATPYVTIAVPTNGQIGGELIWTATSSAAAVRYVANGSIRFWGTDEGGTPVCGINKIGTDGEGHSSGATTLVCTWTNVVSTTNCAVSVTCTNSTVGTDPVTLTGRLNMPTIATATFN